MVRGNICHLNGVALVAVRRKTPDWQWRQWKRTQTEWHEILWTRRKAGEILKTVTWEYFEEIKASYATCSYHWSVPTGVINSTANGSWEIGNLHSHHYLVIRMAGLDKSCLTALCFNRINPTLQGNCQVLRMLYKSLTQVVASFVAFLVTVISTRASHRW